MPNSPRCQKLLEGGQYFISLWLAHTSKFTTHHINCAWWTERLELTRAHSWYTLMTFATNQLHFHINLPLIEPCICPPVLSPSNYISSLKKQNNAKMKIHLQGEAGSCQSMTVFPHLSLAAKVCHRHFREVHRAQGNRLDVSKV